MISLVTTWNSSFFKAPSKVIAFPGQDYRILAETTNRDQALLATLELEPDLLILDCDLPGTASVELIVKIIKLKTHTGVILVLNEDLLNNSSELIRVKADGVFFKEDYPECIVKIIEGLYTGVHWEMVDSTGQMSINEDVVKFSSQVEFQSREMEVFRLIAKGYTNKSIADELSISKKTVEYHIRKILRKLNAKNKAEAVTMAYSVGIFSIEQPWILSQDKVFIKN